MSSNSWTNMCTHTFTRTCTGQEKEPFPPMLEQTRGPKWQQKKEDMSEITAPSISASSSTKPFTHSSSGDSFLPSVLQGPGDSSPHARLVLHIQCKDISKGAGCLPGIWQWRSLWWTWNPKANIVKVT